MSPDISVLKGIGVERKKAFHAMGIVTISDLLHYFPKDYEDRSLILPVCEIAAHTDERHTFFVRVLDKPEVMNLRGLTITTMKGKDDSGTASFVFFNQPYIKNVFVRGDTILITGKIQTNKIGKLEIVPLEFEKVNSDTLLSGGRIVPLYSTTAKISQKLLRSVMHMALEQYAHTITDFFDADFLTRYDLADRNFAVCNIHFPKDDPSFLKARYRLVFEELLLLQLSLFQRKGGGNDSAAKGVLISCADHDRVFIKTLPFTLTNAQQAVLRETLSEMESHKPVKRLIQGDVGSGKTIVAAVLAYVVIQNGYQAVIMAPTEVLAQQHYESFSRYFSAFSIGCTLLCGSLTKKQRTEALTAIQSGTAQMIIGTHALIQEGVSFPRAALVITDEQHRFGVAQRACLTQKGTNPHTLVMTATPIPRTLALILYGDLDISIMNELPPGRQKIDTFSVDNRYRARIYQFIQKELDKGRQVYVICPAIAESETVAMEAALTQTEGLKEIFGADQVCCLHGKMKPAEKKEIMEQFAANQIKILVSTTVIEVGINVPNATIMLIENAERFGLAQLHQLRGRVGRGSEKSYCILMSESKSDITKQRLQTMKATNDGFEIAEKDLQLRGPGEFFGTRQHGLPNLSIANLYKDMPVLKAAQQAAQDIYRDPSNPRYAAIIKKASETFNFEKLSL